MLPSAGITMGLVDLVPGFKAVHAGSLKYSRLVELLGPLWLPQLERDNYGLGFRAGWRFGP
jgi:predicted dinucleotide-binding enzyme